MVDALTAGAWPEGTHAGVDRRRRDAGRGGRRPTARRRRGARSWTGRPATARKTGVFTGSFATNPVTGTRAAGVRRRLRPDGLRHRRDHGRARPGRARLGVRRGLRAADHPHRRSRPRASGRAKAFTGDGPAINSSIDGLSWTAWTSPTAKARDHRVAGGRRARARRGHLPPARLAVQPAALLGRAVPDRLRRDRAADRGARVDAAGRAARDRRLLAEVVPARRRRLDARAAAGPADRLGRGRAGPGRRAEEVPARDEHDAQLGRLVLVRAALPGPDQRRARWSTREVEHYWMGPNADRPLGGVELYVGGVEHAVLHLLYARFWHKVLFDLGYLSVVRAVPPAGQPGHVAAAGVHERRRVLRPGRRGRRARRRASSSTAPRCAQEFGKIGKTLKNVVNPDEFIRDYGADTFRLFEMFSGPLEQSRPWDAKAIVGPYRLLQRVWRVVVDEKTGAVHVVRRRRCRDELNRLLHRAIHAVRDGYETLRFNTSIARITELNNAITAGLPERRGAARAGRAAGADAGAAGAAHRRGAVVAAGPPGVAGVGASSRWPTRRCWSTTRSRSRCRSTASCARWSPVPADADAAAMEAAARADERVAAALDGRETAAGRRRARPARQLRGLSVTRSSGVAVVTDSTACLPAELVDAARHRRSCRCASRSARARRVDGVDVSAGRGRAGAARQGRRCRPRARRRPSSRRCTRRLLDAGASHVVSVHLSAALSGTWESAVLAAQDFPHGDGAGGRLALDRRWGWGSRCWPRPSARADGGVGGRGAGRGDGDRRRAPARCSTSTPSSTCAAAGGSARRPALFGDDAVGEAAAAAGRGPDRRAGEGAHVDARRWPGWSS